MSAQTSGAPTPFANRFVLGPLLGSGGSSAAYRATDLVTAGTASGSRQCGRGGGGGATRGGLRQQRGTGGERTHRGRRVGGAGVIRLHPHRRQPGAQSRRDRERIPAGCRHPIAPRGGGHFGDQSHADAERHPGLSNDADRPTFAPSSRLP
ncbi:MAG: hypothetical protein CVT62_04500 [Actinobacteria bacterium HGW-Actinobacteria-2]|nr:MAG: hypothetical protein CVT62_04500 [Actinobacteria bacterium HGW-Actinobacteria-2]